MVPIKGIALEGVVIKTLACYYKVGFFGEKFLEGKKRGYVKNKKYFPCREYVTAEVQDFARATGLSCDVCNSRNLVWGLSALKGPDGKRLHIRIMACMESGVWRLSVRLIVEIDGTCCWLPRKVQVPLGFPEDSLRVSYLGLELSQAWANLQSMKIDPTTMGKYRLCKLLSRL